MTIFVVTSPKRGSGKSTLAMNLTEYLRLQGNTLYIDTDDNKQNFEWVALHRVERAKAQYNDIFIDITGHDTYALRSVLMQADKLIIPMSGNSENQDMHSEMQQLAINISQFNTQLKVYGADACTSADQNRADCSESEFD